MTLVGTLLAGMIASRSMGAIVLLPLIAVIGAFGSEYQIVQTRGAGFPRA
jgi:hypothetical protein